MPECQSIDFVHRTENVLTPLLQAVLLASVIPIVQRAKAQAGKSLVLSCRHRRRRRLISIHSAATAGNRCHRCISLSPLCPSPPSNKI